MLLTSLKFNISNLVDRLLTTIKPRATIPSVHVMMTQNVNSYFLYIHIPIYAITPKIKNII